jgi:hypothetical protein
MVIDCARNAPTCIDPVTLQCRLILDEETFLFNRTCSKDTFNASNNILGPKYCLDNNNII